MFSRSEDEFKKLVNSDIRDQRSSEAEELRKPENLQRWYHVLLEMKLSTESQLAHDRADRSAAYARYIRGETSEVDYLTYVAERDMWRANVLHFKAGIERKISEAKRCRSRYSSDPRVDKLREAIERHRMALVNTDEYTSIDEELWRALDD